MATKSKKKPVSEAEEVYEYMLGLAHPLKDEINALREIIKSTSSNISERIKWNAPSYYYKKDMFTFNLHNKNLVHLVFHHPEIINIESPLLQGNYKDRRMAYFANMDEIEANKSELQRVITALLVKMKADNGDE